MCLSAAIIYSGILGDVSTSLLTLAGAPAALVRRPTNILRSPSACCCCSLLKDLSKLAFTSLLGCAAVLYTVTFMAIRAFDGFRTAPGGANYAKLPAAGRADL